MFCQCTELRPGSPGIRQDHRSDKAAWCFQWSVFWGSGTVSIKNPPTRAHPQSILHTMQRFHTLFTVVFWALVTAHVNADAPDQNAFKDVIQPFFKAHCSKCHGAERARGDFALHDVKGDSDFEGDSRRWKKILGKLVTQEMPPKSQKQPTKQERAKVVAWITSQLKNTGQISEWNHKLLFPEYGNHVDHQKLFDGTVKDAPWSPSRLWKRSPHIFNAMLLRGIGLGKGRNNQPPASLNKVKQPFALEDKAGIRDYAAITFADSATLGTMIRNAEVIVDRHLEGAIHEQYVRIHGPIPEDQLPKDKKGKPKRPRYRKTEKEFSDIILVKGKPTDEQINSAIEKMFELVVEREPTEKDLKKYREFMRTCSMKAEPTESLRMTLVAIAVSPDAIFRAELGSGPRDEEGRQILGSADLAYAIAYALTDDGPDEKLLSAAKNGRLKTRADVAREVARIWDDDTIEKQRILRFFHEFFGYHKAPGVFKDAARFGKDYRNVAEQLVRDADVLVNYIVKEDKNVLEELLTTEKYFVAHNGDNKEIAKQIEALDKLYEHLKDKDWKSFPYQTPKEHANFARSLHRMFAHPNGNVVKGWMRYLTNCDKHKVTPIPSLRGRQYIEAYNLNEKTFDYPAKQPFVLAKGKRMGILMHPAWLVAHSLNLDNDPVRRGKWIRERLLADSVPELPITVDARIPDAPDQSLRERFAVTRQEQCWRCHVQMNPLGMPFEQFDDFGRYRDVEKLHAPRKTKPVNATGILQGTHNPELDGKVQDPIDLMQRLAKSERVRQSFVRHAFRYWMGRNEMLSDSKTLMDADKAYVENGGSFRALVISLLTSDSFLYRKRLEP